MALDAGELIFVAYDRHTVASSPSVGLLGTLTDAYDKEVMVEDNGTGSGSFTINPLSDQAAWCTAGNYIRVWRDTISGTPIAGFWLEGGDDDILSPDEQGGLAWRRAGSGPIIVLREAIVWHRARLGSGAVVVRAQGFWRWRDSHPARVLIRLLREAQRRGALPLVDWDFTNDEDTDGNAWADDATETYKFDIGADLLSVVEDLRETGLHVEMGPNFVLHAWDDYDNDVSDTVTFVAGDNIRDVAEREVQARRSRSAILVEGDNEDDETRYLPVEDADIEEALGRRKEGYYRYERTATTKALRRVGRRKLRKWRQRHDGVPTLGVIDTTGRVAFEDYRTGDTVLVDIPDEYDEADQRIVAITLQERDDGTYDPILELADLDDDKEREPAGRGDNPPPHAGDTGRHPVDRFDRTAEPPTPTEGAAIAPEVHMHRVTMEQGGWDFTNSQAGAIVGPTWQYWIGHHYGMVTGDRAGWYNSPWPITPCGIGMGAQSGWSEVETWLQITAPAGSTGGGMFMDITCNNVSVGSGATLGADVKVSPTLPTGLGQGTKVGHVTGVETETSTIYIPPEHVPATNELFWVGLSAAWQADHALTFYCNHSPPAAPQNGSLGMDMPTNFHWATLSGAVDLGSAESDEDSPWGESSWEWAVTNADGSPVFGIDGSAIYVTDGAIAVTLMGGTGE